MNEQVIVLNYNISGVSFETSPFLIRLLPEYALNSMETNGEKL